MADLLRTVTIEQGYDAREFVLYAFGGAGPAHAPAFALDVVEQVLIPSSQSVFLRLWRGCLRYHVKRGPRTAETLRPGWEGRR